MPFQCKRFILLLYKTVFATRGTDARLTPRRILVLLVLFPSYVTMLLVHWACLGLDELLFPRFRKQKIVRPLFIVGPPRTGTTLLHRLLAKDDQFTSMRTWEILFAPSIIQKRFWKGVGRLDGLAGSPLRKLVLALEGWQLKEFNKMHKVGLFELEEDDPILLNIFASAFLALVLPFEKDVRPLVFFDEEFPAAEKKKTMAFYRKCVQRHLYVFGKDKVFLSKNPVFSFKVQALQEVFPDSRIICIVRTPVEGVPSAFSYMNYFYDVFCSRRPDSSSKDFIHELLLRFYRYPTERLKRMPEGRGVILKYTDLVSDPENTVLNCFERMGYSAGDKTRTMLKKESERACTFRSKHVYSFEELGLNPEQVAEDYADIIEEFGF